jgi:hypothetical protein
MKRVVVRVDEFSECYMKCPYYRFIDACHKDGIPVGCCHPDMLNVFRIIIRHGEKFPRECPLPNVEE